MCWLGRARRGANTCQEATDAPFVGPGLALIQRRAVRGRGRGVRATNNMNNDRETIPSHLNRAERLQKRKATHHEMTCWIGHFFFECSFVDQIENTPVELCCNCSSPNVEIQLFCKQVSCHQIIAFIFKKKINEGLADQNYIWRTTTINCSSLAFTYDPSNLDRTVYQFYFNDIPIVNVRTQVLAERQVDFELFGRFVAGHSFKPNLWTNLAKWHTPWRNSSSAVAKDNLAVRT